MVVRLLRMPCADQIQTNAMSELQGGGQLEGD